MDNPVQLLSILRKRESLFWLKIAGLLGAGVPLSLTGPALVSFLFWAAYIQWGQTASWGWFFLAFCLVLIPLLYRLEIRAEGDYLGRAAKEFDSQATMPAALAVTTFGQVGIIAAALAHPRAGVAGFVEIFLPGPRLVVGAWRQLKLRRLSRGADLARAAQVLQTLATAPGHVRTESLLVETEGQQKLSRVLAYLLFFDWIGVAHDGSKVWMLSEARRALNAPAPDTMMPAAP